MYMQGSRQTLLQSVPCSVRCHLDGHWSACLKPLGSKNHNGNVWNHVVASGSWAEVNQTSGNRMSDSPWLVGWAQNHQCCLSRCSAFIEEMLASSDQTDDSAAAKLPPLFFFFGLSRLIPTAAWPFLPFRTQIGPETWETMGLKLVTMQDVWWSGCLAGLILSVIPGCCSLSLSLSGWHTHTHTQSVL